MVTAKIMLSNLTKWKVSVTGSHVNANNHDDENQMQWEGPSGNKKILESAKDNIMFSRSYGMKPFEVFRRQIKDISESEMEIAFEDTRTNPSDRRVCDFIKNTEKRHAFNSGQWTSAHKLAITELKESGQLLFYQRDNVEEAGNQDLDRGYVFAVSNQTALQSARQNQHVIGIDGKHGLQDDGAALMTAVTQHKDGFGCPASFTIMNRENTQNIFLAIRSILENVPCGRADCQHPYRYFALPGNLGYRRVTGCSRVNEYKPLVMIDKFEASANACEELGLQYVLCWFHIVKALMEKLTQESVSLLNAYLIILAFKIVARSVCEEVSKERWIMFLEVIDNLATMDQAVKNKLKEYFTKEWWCLKWRYAWLDLTRLPLISEGGRTMTTNNCDENLNLKVANCVGGKRKKVSTLLFELTGCETARMGNEEAVKKKKKASILETHAAKTICHNLGTRTSTPADILLHQNQARFLFLKDKVKTTRLQYIYLVQDEKKSHRFKDNKGNWITVSDTEVLEKMVTSLAHNDLSVDEDENVLDVEKSTCTCTDYLWRSALRDPCVHIQAVSLFIENEREDNDSVTERTMKNFATFLRRKQLARPRQHRDLLLANQDNTVVIDRMSQLHEEHGSKIWEILSTAAKSEKTDRYRPRDLPKSNITIGRPKERTAKPRAANPFKRKRVLNKDFVKERVKLRKVSQPSVKSHRNNARRAATKLVAKAKQNILIGASVQKVALSDPQKDSPDHVHADKMNRMSKQMAPRGPLREHIPMRYHAFVSKDTLNSYLVNSYKEENVIYKKHPEITSVIVKKYSDKLYQKVKDSLNERGLDATLEMDAWLINTLVDQDYFDECICDDLETAGGKMRSTSGRELKRRSFGPDFANF